VEAAIEQEVGTEAAAGVILNGLIPGLHFATSAK
jgi:hypothetical protein